MTLEDAIAAWDCKSRDDILAVHETFCSRATYMLDLIRIAQNPERADGATWLIKHALEQGHGVVDPIGVTRAGSRATTWPAQLHVLQMLPRLGIPVGGVGYTETLLMAAVASPKSMVRAWGYAGCDLLGMSVASHGPKMALVLAKARATETSASVLARLKRCQL